MATSLSRFYESSEDIHVSALWIYYQYGIRDTDAGACYKERIKHTPFRIDRHRVGNVGPHSLSLNHWHTLAVVSLTCLGQGIVPARLRLFLLAPYCDLLSRSFTPVLAYPLHYSTNCT